MERVEEGQSNSPVYVPELYIRVGVQSVLVEVVFLQLNTSWLV